MRPSHSRYNCLFRLVTQALKYFWLSLVGCTIAYIFSIVLDVEILSHLIIAALKHGFSRVLVLVVCLGAVSIIVESIK